MTLANRQLTEREKKAAIRGILSLPNILRFQSGVLDAVLVLQKASVVDPDLRGSVPVLILAGWIRIQVGKSDPQKNKNVTNMLFSSFLLRNGGLDVFHRGTNILLFWSFFPAMLRINTSGTRDLVPFFFNFMDTKKVPLDNNKNFPS
jgi:hypothetical protein